MSSSTLDVYDKTQRGPHAYGYQPVHAWGVRHRDEVVGTQNRRTKKQALAVGPWDGVDRLWADAFPIDAANYVFHPGTLADDLADALFPDEPPHPLFSHISVQTPAGISEDSADKLFGIYRCLRTPDFDVDGNQIDAGGAIVPPGGPDFWPDGVPNRAQLNPDAFFFKPNPFNVSANEILRFGGQPRDLINFPAGVEWRDWNGVLIPWDDTKYTPRSVSLTPAMGAGGFNGLIEIRVVTLRGGDISSASRHTPNQAETRIVVTGDAAIQVNWLIKGDEEDPVNPPGDISGYRIYWRENGGPWRYMHVDIPGIRAAWIDGSMVDGFTDPPDMASAGLIRMIPRFQCMPFFQPPYGLTAAIQRICQIACADYQWSGWGTGTYRNDMIRFLSPETRAPVFELDLAQVAPGTFKAYPVSKQNRYNQVVVNFRDLDDPYLGPGDPVILDREALQDEGINAFTLDIGTAYRSQAQRTAAFYARFIIDLAWQCEVTSSPKTYKLLPANVLNVTHDTPDWVDQQFIIQKKTEKIEGGIGDPIVGHLYAPGIYSDADWSPLPSPLPRGRGNVFAPPPHVTGLMVETQGGFGPDGAWQERIRVTYLHGFHILQQRALIEYRRDADAEWSLWALAAPIDDAGHGQVDISGLSKDIWWVRVRAATIFSQAPVDGAPTAFLDITEVPPAPAPIITNIIKDEFGGYYITWDPGLQPGGLRPPAEQIGHYKIRFRQGSLVGSVYRENPVDEAPPFLTARWTDFSLIGFPCSSPATRNEEGGVLHVGSLTEVGCILLSQPIRRDSIVRFELSDKLPPRVISVINLDGSATEIFWDTTYTAQVPRLVPAFQTANGRRPLPLETYAVAIRQRQASYLGPGDIIMYQSDQLPVDDQYRVQVQFGLNDGEPQELKRVTIEPTEREAFYYSPSMQREDNVRLGNGAVLFDTVYGEIEQISLNPAAPAGIPLHFIGS